MRGQQWARLFAERAPDIEFRQWPDTGDPADVRYMAAWTPPPRLHEVFPNLEILFTTGAGIDHLDLSAIPDSVPLVRMIDPAFAEGMAQYVLHAVLDVHRDCFDYAEQQARGVWLPRPIRSASQVRVGVLGMGNLAKASLHRLVQLGYACAAWSRSAHRMEGVECFAGAQAMRAFLARTEVLVCLLPLTDDTRGLLGEELLSQLPRGASLVQVARGAHLDHGALMRLLASGHLSSARLDVTDPEPLPAGHPLWRHPRVRITPHIATAARPEVAVDAVLENIRRHHDGQPMHGLVDRKRGY
ncbi:2-hydroxyacid dehydrogenase [Caenimonas aquaedulcis]|uniref:2-hydroxyacid dehydrogenase n=1 Tax=Caenimonas aquaedulcis TaxID=2793270 RepID=UPI00338EE8D2